MTEYYRVRTPEQWDWLRDKLKLTLNTPLIDDSVLLTDLDRLMPTKCVSEEILGMAIEVSGLMEDEKMKDYVTIKDEDLEKAHWETNYGRTSFIDYDKNGEKYAHEQFLPANLSIPKSLLQQQVKMTKAEKAEFDKLNKEWTTLSLAISAINDEFLEYPLLHNRLFGRMTSAKKNEAQIEFARAWADPSLIEVVKEPKFNVKVPNTKDCLYYKINNSVRAGVPQRHPSRFKFTASELKQYGLDSDMYEKVEVKE